MGQIEEIDDDQEIKEAEEKERKLKEKLEKEQKEKLEKERKLKEKLEKEQKEKEEKERKLKEKLENEQKEENAMPYKICKAPEIGRYVEATRDVKKDEILWTETPLVVAPVTVSPPVCLHCYNPVDGSYLCRKSGWPLCGAKCEKKVKHNPEVVIPHQTEAQFVIDDYNIPSYLYECIGPMRVLFMQKSAPKKYNKIRSLESHHKLRKGTDNYNKSQENVVEVMKKTLGVMVIEAFYPQFDFGDETIQEIVGIFETNSIEIRLPSSEIHGLFEIGSMMEHSCEPNVALSFDNKFNMTVKAGRDIAKGEHLSIMYTHSLWGTQARRSHLNDAKKFWCNCNRCADPTEFGTEFSTILREGKLVRPENPLDQETKWVSKDGTISIPSYQVAGEMEEIGAELAVLQLQGTIEEYEGFIAKNETTLHQNHYHFLTAKHTLLQMLGRSEGCLIQDMPMEKLKQKEHLCREVVALCQKLDPAMVRLQIYTASSLFELHLPLLQYGKRKWETGELATDDFRKTLYEPRDILVQAMELLQDEQNDNLPEGQLRLQIKETLNQLENFMKTLGCEDI